MIKNISESKKLSHLLSDNALELEKIRSLVKSIRLATDTNYTKELSIKEVASSLEIIEEQTQKVFNSLLDIAENLD